MRKITPAELISHIASKSSEMLKSLRSEKKKIQAAKGPMGYTRKQAFDLVIVNDKIREVKRAIILAKDPQ